MGQVVAKLGNETVNQGRDGQQAAAHGVGQPLRILVEIGRIPRQRLRYAVALAASVTDVRAANSILDGPSNGTVVTLNSCTRESTRASAHDVVPLCG